MSNTPINTMTPGQAIQKTKLPKGFFANSVNCGVRKYRPDLGIVWSDRDCVAAGVFTTNECKAAPVKYCQSILPSTKIRYVIANSGQANAATGLKGQQDNDSVVQYVADKYGGTPEQVIISSTGVIGVPLEIEKIYFGINELFKRESLSIDPFALAIMTTDLVPKSVFKEIELSGGTVTLTGACKGSGMIHPNMATMLGYVFTDAQLDPEQVQTMVKESADVSFNMISVDGETSTNDSYFLVSNGASDVALETEQDKRVFKEALCDLAIIMAKSIAADGEGASKLIEVRMEGCPELDMARKAARGVVSSPLIKAAVHGEDPNWGRIFSRLGQYGIPAELMDKLDLSIQGVDIVKDGDAVSFDYRKMKTRFSEDVVYLDLNFHSGEHRAVAWGCDLSKAYVEINTAYN